MKLSEVRFLDLGGPDKMEQAFRDGQGDYIHLQAPAPQQLEREGGGSIVARVGEGLHPCAFSSVCGSAAFLDSPVAPAFLRAFGRAKTWVQSAAPMSVAVAEHSYFPGISLPSLASSIQGYQDLGTWVGGTDIHPAEYEQTQAVFATVGSLLNRYPWERVCRRLVT